MASDGDNAQGRIVTQMDDLQAQARRYRDKKLGENWAKDVKSFYENMNPAAPFEASFARRVSIPALQMMMLHEVADLAFLSPRIYIGTDASWGETDKGNERALEAQWQQSSTNMAFIYSILWSLFSGTGFLQVGYDPLARQGIGDVFVDWRAPDTVFVDPNAKNDDDWKYVLLEDAVYMDQIWDEFPERARFVDSVPTRGSGGQAQTENRGGALPEGPFQSMPPLGFTSSGPDKAGTVKKRTLFIRDSSVMDAPPAEIGDPHPPAEPDVVPRYPTGRLIVECNGTILFDDRNWVPNGNFPLVRVAGMPSIEGFWGPPPVRYSQPLQEQTERIWSQVYENMYRMNRPTVFIRADSGINPETFMALPAAAYEYNMTSVPPTFGQTSALPAEYLQLPQTFLELQRTIQGFPASRMGSAPAGNISAPLFEAAISQSQGITRLRAMMLAGSVEKVGQLILMAMQVFYRSKRIIPGMVKGQFQAVEWTPVPEGEVRFAKLDPASVRPLSQTAQRMLVPLLRQMRMMDVKHGLDMLDIPDGEEIALAVNQEAQQSAIASMKGKK